jgi:glycosyl transferase family 87
MWDLPYIVLVLPNDFDYYLHAAIDLASGQNIYYDWMAESVREGIGSWYLYPPYFAAALYPLTFFGRITAEWIFAAVVILSVLGIDYALIRLRRRIFPNAFRIDLLVHSLVFFAMPTRLLVGSLQVEGLLFLLFLISMIAMIERWNVWFTGAAITLGVLIKIWPAPYMASMFSVLRWRMIYPVIIVSSMIVALFTLFFGVHAQWVFLSDIFPVLMSYADAYKDNQSLTLFAQHHLFLSDNIIRVVRWAILCSYLYMTYRSRHALRNYDSRAIVINAALFLSVSLLITPTAWTAGHIRLLLPIMLLCGLCLERGRQSFWLSLATMSAIVCYIYPQELLKKILPIWIDRFPMLYAAILLYGIFMALSFHSHNCLFENPPNPKQ